MIVDVPNSAAGGASKIVTSTTSPRWIIVSRRRRRRRAPRKTASDCARRKRAPGHRIGDVDELDARLIDQIALDARQSRGRRPARAQRSAGRQGKQTGPPFTSRLKCLRAHASICGCNISIRLRVQNFAGSLRLLAQLLNKHPAPIRHQSVERRFHRLIHRSFSAALSRRLPQRWQQTLQNPTNSLICAASHCGVTRPTRRARGINTKCSMRQS